LSIRRDEPQRPSAQSQAPSPALARRRARVRFWRRLIIRLIAVLSSLVALVGIVGSVSAYRQISGAQRSAQTELRQIGDNFAQVSVTLATVSTSAGNASTSVGEARVALDDAAKTTRGVADTLDQTAGVINFTVPGTTYKPLAGVDTSFREQARQLRTVADDVAKTNTALGQNGTDLKAISDDVSTVSRQMADISAQLRSLSNDGDGSLSMITNATRLVIIWSGIIHLLLLLVGVSLFLLTVEDLVLANERSPGGGRPDVGDDVIEW
jgi:septal ring factor EnvC (AmiA/AmiB activator)